MKTSLALAAALAVLSASASARPILTGHIPQAAKQAIELSRVSPSQELTVSITLPLRNTNALETLLAEISNPASPKYGQYLSAKEFAEQFGPSQTDYLELIGFCKSQNLRVAAVHPNRTTLTVTGKATDMEKTFHTTLKNYRHQEQNRVFHAPEQEPSCDCKVQILHVHGLDNLHQIKAHKTHSAIDLAQPEAGSSKTGLYMGNDFRNAYVPGMTLKGEGQTIALVEFDGFYAGDITAYNEKAGLAGIPITVVPIDGFNMVPGTENSEVSLDIQVVTAMAPKLSKLVVYETDINGDPLSVLNRIATDNSARQISCSWTWSGIDKTAQDQIFKQFSAQGQSFFTASGDSGAYNGEPDSPADSPYITVVGGTTLTMSGAGLTYSNEVVWNDQDGTATGGGICTNYPIPSWQVGFITNANHGATNHRNIPDVAIVAASVLNIGDNGVSYNTEGTSVAAPLWAAFAALVNQEAQLKGKSPIGFVNPTLYAMAKTTNYAKYFHDIRSGNNVTFFATTNYDLCTGLGTPTGSNTLMKLIGITNLDVDPTDHLTLSTTNGSWSINTSIPLTISANTSNNSTSTGFTNSLTLSAYSIVTNTIFNRTFDSDTTNTLLNDWYLTTGEEKASMATPGAVGSAQCVMITGGSTTNRIKGLCGLFSGIRPSQIEFYVKTANNNSNTAYMRLNAIQGWWDPTTNLQSYITQFHCDSNGFMGVLDGGGNFYSTPYVSNQWYKVGLRLDWQNKALTYYVNDALIVAGVSFCSSNATGIYGINLDNVSRTKVWWDQFNMWSTTNVNLPITPSTVTCKQGQWTGTVAVGGSTTNVFLSAQDTQGHLGYSSPLTITVPVTVTATPARGGVVTGAGDWITGNTVTLHAAPNTGWTLVSWTDGDTNLVRQVTVGTNQATYVANFGELPTVSQGLTNMQAEWGKSVTLSVNAGGASPVGYQWLKNGTPIPNATNSAYSLDLTGASYKTTLTCKISNAVGTVTSSSTVYVNPRIESIKFCYQGLDKRMYNRIHIVGPADCAYTLFQSTDLKTWTQVTDYGSQAGNIYDFAVPETGTMMFYRVMASK